MGLYNGVHTLGFLNSIPPSQMDEMQKALKAGPRCWPGSFMGLTQVLGRSSTENPTFCIAQCGGNGFGLGTLDSRC